MFFGDWLHTIRSRRAAARLARQPIVPPSVQGASAWSLERPLLRLSPRDVLTIGDCATGVQIFGASGSGKTSGSLALLARAMLADGWGALVHTTKPDEAQQWVRWCAQTGRAADVVRITPNGPHRFNLLDYLDRHPDPGASVASNIADVLMTLAAQAKPKGQTNDTSEFFAESAALMATHAIHLLRAAGVPLSLAAIHEVIGSAPVALADLGSASFRSGLLSELLTRADERATASPDPHQARRAARLEEVCHFWLRTFPTMSDRTRGDVIATLNAVIFRFTEPPFDGLIAAEGASTFIPEMATAGRILILDCPVVTYALAGRLFQIAIKHLTQQAILRRPRGDSTRPVAIFADEAQNFATHADFRYQAVCRDYRGSTVYATQSIDNYREAVGSEPAVEALLASLVTKVFHANAGSTNEWAERIIAKDWGTAASTSMNQREDQQGMGFGSSLAQQIHPQVLAAEFTRLRTGGPRNGFAVEAIVFQPGRIFEQSGKAVMRVVFPQTR